MQTFSARVDLGNESDKPIGRNGQRRCIAGIEGLNGRDPSSFDLGGGGRGSGRCGASRSFTE